MKNNIRQSQIENYRELYKKYKGTPMAVSSESWNHKHTRFRLICDIIRDDDSITVHDVGMGIADMGEFIITEFPNKKIQYSGTEILDEFVEEAKKRFPNSKFYNRDIAEQSFDDRYDYLLLSGVFHQRRDSTIRDWEKFYQQILKNSFEMCDKGIAFNFISPYVDFYQTQVYYCNLPKLINFINDDLSRFFEIKHNYALFEFTVYVYKEHYIKSQYIQPEFQKYFKV
jgi:hypothetical protein